MLYFSNKWIHDFVLGENIKYDRWTDRVQSYIPSTGTVRDYYIIQVYNTYYWDQLNMNRPTSIINIYIPTLPDMYLAKSLLTVTTHPSLTRARNTNGTWVSYTPSISGEDKSALISLKKNKYFAYFEKRKIDCSLNMFSIKFC